MECCDCCNYGPILPNEAMNDRLYWVEIVAGAFSGAKCAAWRTDPESHYQWTAFIPDEGRFSYRDEYIRIIHEIIPED